MPLQDEKKSFLAYELGLLTLKAALSTRAENSPIYSNDCKVHQREHIKRSFRQELDGLASFYAAGAIPESEHVDRIADVANRLSAQHHTSLHRNTFRYGVAQKMINMHLKYLWSAGVIEEPPHCPIDGIIRDKAGLNYDWTTSDSAEEYKAAIASLKEHAQPRTLAIWELQEFHRRAQS